MNSESRMQRIMLVVNPVARTPPTKVVDAVMHHAPPRTEIDVRYTVRDQPIHELIADGLADIDAIVACGGDGTVADVITAIAGHDLPVGVIPSGSTNVVARENRIPLRTDAAAALLFRNHREVRLDVGICGDRRFLHMAGAGIDSRLFASTNPALKRRVGWAAYVPAALESMLAPPVQFKLKVDGTRVEFISPLVLIANGASLIRQSLPIYPGLRRDDGLLDVIAFTPVGPLQTGRTLMRLATRSLHHSPYVVRLRGRDISLATEPSIPFQLDGDVIGMTPARFTIQSQAIRLIVPAK
jgi:diacylglycerol kinase family enzyme